jgi:hypothetical protein
MVNKPVLLLLKTTLATELTVVPFNVINPLVALLLLPTSGILVVLDEVNSIAPIVTFELVLELIPTPTVVEVGFAPNCAIAEVPGTALPVQFDPVNQAEPPEDDHNT